MVRCKNSYFFLRWLHNAWGYLMHSTKLWKDGWILISRVPKKTHLWYYLGVQLQQSTHSTFMGITWISSGAWVDATSKINLAKQNCLCCCYLSIKKLLGNNYKLVLLIVPEPGWHNNSHFRIWAVALWLSMFMSGIHSMGLHEHFYGDCSSSSGCMGWLWALGDRWQRESGSMGGQVQHLLLKVASTMGCFCFQLFSCLQVAVPPSTTSLFISMKKVKPPVCSFAHSRTCISTGEINVRAHIW